MDNETFKKRIKEYNENFMEQIKDDTTKKEESVNSGKETVDVYDINRKARLEESKTSRPNGSPSIVLKVTQDIISERLGRAYKKARDDSELLEKQGEPERAKLVRDQYMQEWFLPSIESVIMFASPDELLNATKALSALDELVLNETGGSGYTASYVRTAYKDSMGNSRDLSDPTVKRAVTRIKDLADCGNNRLCYGLAKQIKKQIDDGEHIASDVDYELISRVSAYFR